MNSRLGRLMKLAAGVACSGAAVVYGADLGTAFTYQGRLVKDGTPVTSDPPHCDFTFGLWDQQGPGGNQKGNSPQAVNDVEVIEGLFAVSIDFGSGAMKGSARWLEITVQCPGDAMSSTLLPRQELKPAPHAMALPGLYIQQNGVSPSLIGGHSENFVWPSVVGAVIAGGGKPGLSNYALDDFCTVSGGSGNEAGFDPLDPMGTGATVSGGQSNYARGSQSTIGGGCDNETNFFDLGSTIGGGCSNFANAILGTIPGGGNNQVTGNYGFAAGQGAKALHQGAFVWSDSSEFVNGVSSTGNNQFLIRASGGVRLSTGNGTNPQLQAVVPSTDTPTNLAMQALGGNVGIGTGNPTSKVEIAAQDGLAITGFQPFLTLRDTNAGNARARIANANGSMNFFPESFIGMNPPLMIETGSGRVGIGDTTPDVALDVIGDIHYTGVITDVSDERLKENVHPIQSALDKVTRLHGVSFSMKGTPDAREVGLIAQEVQKVLPEAVRVVDPENGYLGVSYPSLIPLLVEAIKDVQREITTNHNNEAAQKAIQGLHQLVQKKDCEIAELRAEKASEIEELTKRLVRLETLVAGTNRQEGKP